MPAPSLTKHGKRGADIKCDFSAPTVKQDREMGAEARLWDEEPTLGMGDGRVTVNVL